jgi:hypothetical protein
VHIEKNSIHHAEHVKKYPPGQMKKKETQEKQVGLKTHI